MNFWTLFGFEVKKLFRRKLVWLCLAAMIAMSLVQGFLSNNSSSHSFNGIEISGEEYQRMTRKAEEALKQAMAAQPEPQKEALEDVRLFGEEPVQPAPAPNPMERREKFFKVFVTREELQALNHFLISNGYTFREIKNQ